MTIAETLPAATPGEPVGLLVGGDRITNSSGAFHDHIYPATGRPNATIVLAGAAEIDLAVASAREAQREHEGRCGFHTIRQPPATKRRPRAALNSVCSKTIWA